MEGLVGVRQQLAGGDLEIAERSAEMGEVVLGAWMGGGGCPEVWNVLDRGGSSGAPLHYLLVRHVPADWEDDGWLSLLGDMVADGEDATL